MLLSVGATLLCSKNVFYFLIDIAQTGGLVVATDSFRQFFMILYGSICDWYYFQKLNQDILYRRINIWRKADNKVVNDCSSLFFTSIYQPKHSDLCENCKTLECELHKTQGELKSAQLITDLLVQEINFTKASTGASKM